MIAPKYAVIFKALDDSPGHDPYCERLEAMGIICKTIPVISFKFVNKTELTSKLNQPDSYSGIIFSSPRSVDAVRSCEFDVTKWKNHKMYSVGGKTSIELEKFGFKPEGNNGNAELLANYLVKLQHSKPLLLPVGNLSFSTILNKLTTNDVKVDFLFVYETLPNPDLNDSFIDIFKNKISYVLYFSPTGVESTLPLFEINNVSTSDIQFGAIGRSTAIHLEKNSVRPAFIATRPTPEGFAQALFELIQSGAPALRN